MSSLEDLQMLEPSEHIVAMLPMDSSYSNKVARNKHNIVLSQQIQAGADALAALEADVIDPTQASEFQAVVESGHQAKCELLLNTLPILERWLFATGARDAEKAQAMSARKARLLELTAGPEIDDIWQDITVQIFARNLEEWQPGKTPNLPNYLFPRISVGFSQSIAKSSHVKGSIEKTSSALAQAETFETAGYFTPNGAMIDGQPFQNPLDQLPTVEPLVALADVFDDEKVSSFAALAPSVELSSEHNFESFEAAMIVPELLKRLDEDERRIVDLCFGLTSGEPLGYREVGRITRHSYDTIRKINMRALQKLGANLDPDTFEVVEPPTTTSENSVNSRRTEAIKRMKPSDRLYQYIDVLRAYQETHFEVEENGWYVPPDLVFTINMAWDRRTGKYRGSEKNIEATIQSMLQSYSSDRNQYTSSILKEDLSVLTKDRVEAYLESTTDTEIEDILMALSDSAVRRCMRYIEQHKAKMPKSSVDSPWLD